MASDLSPGRTYPIGATVYPDGVNFCIYSKNATAVELLFFDDVDTGRPVRTIRLDRRLNRTFFYWHVFVRGIRPGQIYAYRVYGPHEPQKGLRFNGRKILLDPYGRAVVTGRRYDREAAIHEGDNTAQALKSAVCDNRSYNWGDDRRLNIAYADTVVYEMHVGGFTRHPSSGLPENIRGTYRGVAEKIPYLKDLGITAVELLPVQQFDEQDAPGGLTNYWGYSPIGFFAPHNGYSSRKDPLGPVDEFRDMVRALHKAGIEVILDVVFNHTAEGNAEGPTFSFKGLENPAYYLLDPVDRSRFANYSGCGNTMNTNFSIMRRLILDCLYYWVTVMHVDGFRFDLASVMSRGERGELLEAPPILWSIDSDPVLAGTKIIAEAWDAAGLYQVGQFVGDRFSEWNGRFRDDVRRFVKGDEDCVPALAKRITGSPDIYTDPRRDSNRSINFVTSHDGFTLNDLVSYNQKHNEANRENNQDGSNFNLSWNCGNEGPEPALETLRQRQIRNFLTILLLSQGTPMLLMGDEIRRTQSGNNNAYCQDNATSWLDWDLVRQNSDLFRYIATLLGFIRQNSLFTSESYLEGRVSATRPYIIWHGVRNRKPDWQPSSRSLAFEIRNPRTGEHIFAILNAYWEDLRFEIPSSGKGFRWHRIADTAIAPPQDIFPVREAPVFKGRIYSAKARSCVLFSALPDRSGKE